jgi:SSS family transporter
LPTSLTPRLSPPDLALVALYLLAITLFGLRFSRKNKQGSSLKSYFLADNTIPWWAIALSIVSAETSTLTIISIPGVAFGGDFGFLQIVIGYMLGRIVVAALFLPKYFRGEMLTAYQLIDRRFGHTLHKVTAGLFLLTRAAAEGVRVFAISIVVGIAIGTGDTLSIAIISALTLLYTFEGGMAAVIWTDVVQMALYVAGTLVALFTLSSRIPGGWSHIHAVAAPLGKFHIFNFALNLTTTYTFWAGVLGGTFLTMASHGTDQLMVQRMLAARNLRESRLALLSSGAVIFLQFTLFLLIGTGLFVFYGNHPQAFSSPDRIFPTFIVQQMPHGVAGLLIAAILAAAMSNLSAALNSLASTTVVDFYLPWRSLRASKNSVILSEAKDPCILPGPAAIQPPQPNTTLISRLATVFWAIVLFAIAVYAIQHGGKGHVVETGLSIASVAYGCLLGVFLLGTLTRYATQRGAIVGMLCGFIFNLTLWLSPPNLPIPHVAFTWYVLLGALVTFAIGTLASLILPKTRAKALASLLLLLSVAVSTNAQTAPLGEGHPERSAAQSKDPEGVSPAQAARTTQPQTHDFSQVSNLITTAIAQHKLPGAVVLIGHNGQIVFHQAYGLRKLAGEPVAFPGTDGKPDLRPEPMTEDTLFDMASLSKVLATTTAILQLYEQHKLDPVLGLDAPVARYLPDFAQNNKQTITIRQLLTHYSGLPEDVSLKDDWGLAAPDKAEGIRRAMTSIPYGPPGITFKYSDINFITLGTIVEKLSGQDLDVYAREHVFAPLAMSHTAYHPFAKTCGPAIRVGAAIEPGPKPIGRIGVVCLPGTWSPYALDPETAPTAHDDESKLNPGANPDFDHLLRGTVHDPTTRRMGGVAGHAGVFSTAADAAKFCQALLDKLLHNKGPFPLQQTTLQLATSPNEPASASNQATIFTQDGQTTKGVASRGLGWDLNTAFSRPRGTIFPITTKGHPGSFGHTGFTGTSLWLDPTSDTYVILLANAIHPHVIANISPLRGAVATAAAQALGLSPCPIPPKTPVILSGAKDPCISSLPLPVLSPAATDAGAPSSRSLTAQGGVSSEPGSPASAFARRGGEARPLSSPQPQFSGQAVTHEGIRCARPVICDQFGAPALRTVALSSNPKSPGAPSFPGTIGKGGNSEAQPPSTPYPKTLTGIDVLEQTNFAPLALLARRHHNHLNLGILTNQSGLDAHGRRTIDILAHALPELQLTTLFAPEHGLYGKQDTEHLAAETDPITHLPVLSLYGPKPSDRRPKPEDLAKLDAVVIDLQDAGVRFWTYETLVGNFLQAAMGTQVEIVILDRPNPIGGLAVQGPTSDPERNSNINFMPLPTRHGMTLGELAQYFLANAPTIAAARQNTAPVIHATHTPPMQVDGQTGEVTTLPSPEAQARTRLTIIPMQNWSRTEFYAQTGVPWLPPSPNLRTPRAAILYPGVAWPEQTNVSVGRGTETPFENLGAPYINAAELAAYLTKRNIPGIRITPTTMTIAEDANKYPFHGQTIPAIHFEVTGPAALNSPELGVELLSALHRLYPTQFQLAKAKALVANAQTLAAITAGQDPRDIAASWTPSLEAFSLQRRPALLYPQP